MHSTFAHPLHLRFPRFFRQHRHQIPPSLSNTLWLFCPAGKVFDFGDAKYHYRFYEYGRNRSKFMWKALENVHPQFELQFFPSPKTEVYSEMLENLRVNAPTDCTDSECELCRFRRTLPSTSESLLALAHFFLKHDYSC